MDPFTIMAVVGAVTSGIGLFEEDKAASEQEDIAAQQQAVNKKASKIKQKALDAQFATDKGLFQIASRQENLRLGALKIDSTRALRELARTSQAARAELVAGAQNSGGLTSTGFLGASADLLTQKASQRTTILDNRRRGLAQFDLNQQSFGLQTKNARAQSGFNKQLAKLDTKNQGLAAQGNNAAADAAFGRSLFNTGTQIIGSAATADRVATSLFKGTGS